MKSTSKSISKHERAQAHVVITSGNVINYTGGMYAAVQT